VREVCLSLRAKEKTLWLAKLARSSHEVTADGSSGFISVAIVKSNKRNYHNRTIHGPMREAQAYLTRKLGERDLGRDLEAAKSHSISPVCRESGFTICATQQPQSPWRPECRQKLCPSSSDMRAR